LYKKTRTKHRPINIKKSYLLHTLSLTDAE
jgi:hypothetical protein